MNNIHPTKKVNNPKLTLYFFHLRNSLSKGSEKTVKDSELIWEKCQELGKKLGILELESLPEKLRKNQAGTIGTSPDSQLSRNYNLLAKQFLKFSSPHQTFPQLTGEIYPRQFHDTYAVDLTFRYPYENVDLSELHGLNYQGCLLPSQIQASLGQTLMLFVEPSEKIKNEEETQEFADLCLKGIIPSSELQKWQKYPPVEGKLLHSPIFEYNNGEIDTLQSNPILVWLNYHPQTESLEDEGHYYEPLVNLLCSRSKIFYAYLESRECQKKAKKVYVKIEKYLKNFNRFVQSPKRLQIFQKLLKKLPYMSLNYRRYIRDLEDNNNTIKSNIYNYKICLKEIKKLPGTDPVLFELFLEKSCRYFQDQIKIDLSFLLSGEKIFEELIDDIRDILAIDQIESNRRFQFALQEQEQKNQDRERRLQILIFAAGGGITVGGIVASSSGQVTLNNPIYFSCPPETSCSVHPFTWFVIVSIMSSIVGAMLAALIAFVLQEIIMCCRSLDRK